MEENDICLPIIQQGRVEASGMQFGRPSTLSYARTSHWTQVARCGWRGYRFLKEGERCLECRTINNKTEFTATGKWRRRAPLCRRIL